MVFTHRRPGLWQNRQSPATVRPSTVIRRAKKEACGLQQGPYPHRSSSPVRGPCNAPGLLPLGSGTLRAAANWVTRPGFLNAALQASDWGNSSWLCQSRKGGLYPVPGLEVAQADLEAMGRGMGFRMKVLTHWENLAARGSSEGWDPAGPALGARLAAVSSRRAVMTFVRRQDPVPCSGGGFARRLRVQRESKARAVPRCSLLGPQHGDGDRGARQLPPRAAHWGGTGWPQSCTPCASDCKVQGLGEYPHGLGGTARAHPSSRGLQSHRLPRWQPSGACPGNIPHPRLGMGGMLSPGSSGAVEEKVAERGGEGMPGQPGSSSRTGDILELGVNCR